MNEKLVWMMLLILLMSAKSFDYKKTALTPFLQMMIAIIGIVQSTLALCHRHRCDGRCTGFL